MVTPKSNQVAAPSAFDSACGKCEARTKFDACTEIQGRHWCEACGHCSWSPPIRMAALWGHEWALVAWLAENEKRKAVLWEYLDSIRGLCTEADPYTLDTLPEDAMQLLCVNLPDPNECRCRWSGSSREQREQNRSTALCPIHN